MKKKKVTSLDVAQKAGVSQASVSLILNGSEKISFAPETKERVFAAAQELGYTLPHRSASTSRRHSHLLLVLTPTLSNPYYAEAIQTIEQYAETQDYHVIVCNTYRRPDLEKYYLDTFIANHVDGVIYTFLPSFPRLVEQINTITPVVIIGEKRNEPAVLSIELSNETAGAMVIEHLYQLGHRHFAFVSTPFSHLSMAREQRLSGMQKQLALHGLDKSHIEVFCPDDDSSEEDGAAGDMPYEFRIGRHLTAEMLQSGSRATALIGVNDMTACGIVAELLSQGRRIPKDYSVCGFDNIFTDTLITPTLTTIDHHMRRRCESAVDMLIREGGSPDRTSPYVNKIEYTPQLIVRESTGACPRKEDAREEGTDITSQTVEDAGMN